MKTIPIFQLTFEPDFRAAFHQGCEEIFNEGYLTNHTMVRRAEAKFAEMNLSEFCLATSSGTSALEVALRAIDVKNAEVILPANTFIATYLAVVHAGGIPVVADIEDEYYSLNPAAVKKLMTSKTKAVITVHIGGHISPEVFKLKDICKEHGIYLVEDAAHAHFAECNGVKAGNIGDIGCFSFHMTKVVTSGEGGMITTSHKDLFDRCQSIRQFGMDNQNKHYHVLDGSNFKLSEFNALAIILDLDRSHERIAKRRLISSWYQAKLGKSGLKVQSDSQESKGSYYKQIMTLPENASRKKIEQELSQRGISLTNGVYFIPLHHQPVTALEKSTFPVTEKFSQGHICPPCYPELSKEDIDYVCENLLEVLSL